MQHINVKVIMWATQLGLEGRLVWHAHDASEDAYQDPPGDTWMVVPGLHLHNPQPSNKPEFENIYVLAEGTEDYITC